MSKRQQDNTQHGQSQSDRGQSGQGQSNQGHWIDAWLETQRGWLGRWQSLAVEQRADAMRVAMDTLRSHVDPQAPSGAALNVVQSFQTLLQSCMAASGVWAQQNATESAAQPWQQALNLFPLGPAREQHAAWQAYLTAQTDYQVRLQALLAAYAQVFTESLQAVPAQAQARAEQGQAVQGFRELYELWIECGERAFAQLAHDAAFIETQAAVSNALSRLQLAQQAIIEQWLKTHDLPTRSELNSVHLQLRDLRARVQELEQHIATHAGMNSEDKRPS